jgi:hypothetical protein
VTGKGQFQPLPFLSAYASTIARRAAETVALAGIAAAGCEGMPVPRVRSYGTSCRFDHAVARERVNRCARPLLPVEPQHRNRIDFARLSGWRTATPAATGGATAPSAGRHLHDDPLRAVAERTAAKIADAFKAGAERERPSQRGEVVPLRPRRRAKA